MDRGSERRPNGPSSSRGAALRGGVISQELVDAITDRVYAKLLLELGIERERAQLRARGVYRGRGG